MEIVYSRDIEAENLVYACRGPFACDGLFLANLDDTEPEWETLAPGSPRWDFFHQQIFYAYRVKGLDPTDLPSSLRTVPPKPVGPFPSAESYVAPDSPIPAAAYPRAAARLVENTLTIYVLLGEDLYESRLGDGEFHDLHSVYLSEDEARAAAEKLTSEWSRYHLRTVTIRLDDEGVFDFPNFEFKLFDHYKLVRVLAALENILTP